MAELFDRKNVIVTGASSGIGRAVALAFAAEGARVVITGRHKEDLDAVARLDSRITAVVADVVKPEDAAEVVNRAVERGGVDVLVNNAGTARFEPIESLSLDAAREQIETNIYGVIVMTRAALQSLADRKGVIVNISSAAARFARPGGSVYAATKAAVDSLSRSWAAEFAPRGIRVNSVAPGPVETAIFEKMPGTPQDAEARKQKLLAKVSLGRMGQPEEIARWVLHVADPAASWMTAQVIGVDGGIVS